MADDTTGVRVKRPTAEDHHPSGRDVGVTDGHLFVYDSTNRNFAQVVAAYAPQQWLSVVVERASQQG